MERLKNHIIQAIPLTGLIVAIVEIIGHSKNNSLAYGYLRHYLIIFRVLKYVRLWGRSNLSNMFSDVRIPFVTNASCFQSNGYNISGVCKTHISPDHTVPLETKWYPTVVMLYREKYRLSATYSWDGLLCRYVAFCWIFINVSGWVWLYTNAFYKNKN